MKTIQQPEIFYEEDAQGLSNGLPFMKMNKNNTVPKVLFIGACSETDELVEGTETGETVTEIVMQSYYNSEALKMALTEDEYTRVKRKLGLIK